MSVQTGFRDYQSAAVCHRYRVRRWLRADYPMDEAIQDVDSAFVASGGVATPSQCLRALKGKPFGYSPAEDIVGSPESEYCELAGDLASCLDQKIGRQISRSLILNGRLPSRAELASSAQCTEWEARQALELIQSVALRVLTMPT